MSLHAARQSIDVNDFRQRLSSASDRFHSFKIRSSALIRSRIISSGGRGLFSCEYLIILILTCIVNVEEVLSPESKIEVEC